MYIYIYIYMYIHIYIYINIYMYILHIYVICRRCRCCWQQPSGRTHWVPSCRSSLSLSSLFRSVSLMCLSVSPRVCLSLPCVSLSHMCVSLPSRTLSAFVSLESLSHIFCLGLSLSHVFLSYECLSHMREICIREKYVRERRVFLI